jgi:hypothetical protein
MPGMSVSPAGIDDVGRVLAELADRGDAAVPDRDISADRVVPEPVDHGGARIRRSCIGILPPRVLSSIEDKRFVLLRVSRWG